ncbi:hypothetical protein, partial [Enterobacter hormaechei]
SVFNFIPRNDFIKDESDDGNYRKENSEQGVKMRASLWPVAAANSRDVLSNEGSMPFSFSFWKEYSLYNYNLNNIKGFIT